MFWFLSRVCNFTNLDMFMFSFLSLKKFILPKLFWPNFYPLSDLVSVRFKENKVFKLTSGSHKKLKIELLGQVFHDDYLFSAFIYFFFSFSFGLIGFGLYYIGMMAILRLSICEKSLCVSLCFEGKGDLLT